MRELKQAARLQRTPIILSVVTGMMTLLICSVGGVASTTAEPAKVGVGIFHTFFSLAYAVVTWIGPAVAANTIAGERSGRTWEALQLTGLGPRRIARGKFLAAYTYICLYIVMLVPVGALPFLFGGVTATEVLIAFLILFLLAALAVAFGLSVSAKFQSPAAAIIVTLLVALPAIARRVRRRRSRSVLRRARAVARGTWRTTGLAANRLCARRLRSCLIASSCCSCRR